MSRLAALQVPKKSPELAHRRIIAGQAARMSGWGVHESEKDCLTGAVFTNSQHWNDGGGTLRGTLLNQDAPRVEQIPA